MIKYAIIELRDFERWVALVKPVEKYIMGKLLTLALDDCIVNFKFNYKAFEARKEMIKEF